MLKKNKTLSWNQVARVIRNSTFVVANNNTNNIKMWSNNNLPLVAFFSFFSLYFSYYQFAISLFFFNIIIVIIVIVIHISFVDVFNSFYLLCSFPLFNFNVSKDLFYASVGICVYVCVYVTICLVVCVSVYGMASISVDRLK